MDEKIIKIPMGHSSIRLVDLVTFDAMEIFSSKQQARQRIKEGVVKLDGQTRTNPNEVLELADFSDEGLRLQVGKRCHFRVIDNS